MGGLGEAQMVAAPVLSNVAPRRARRLNINFTGVAGLTLTIFFVVIAVAAPLVAPADPYEQDLLTRLRAPSWLEGGLEGHLLGTDQLGRDLLSRIIYGARVSLLVSFLAVVISALVGLPLGALAGYVGGTADFVIQRLIEIQMGLPFILVAIILTVLFAPGTGSLIIILGLSGWVQYGRVTRIEVLSLKEREYVTAAHAVGCSSLHILLRHILPNLLPTLIVIGSIQLSQFIMAEATLSFLGLGILPPTASWGVMVNEGREFIWRAWWIQTFPGIAMVLCVSGVGLLGNWLRDRLDPRLRV